MEPHLLKMWKEAARTGESYFRTNTSAARLPKSASSRIPMPMRTIAGHSLPTRKIFYRHPGLRGFHHGKYFASYTYGGQHRKKKDPLLPTSIMKRGLDYFTHLYDWYMEASKDAPVAFLQLGGGIAADFPICVVPLSSTTCNTTAYATKRALSKSVSSPMSYGSYSGAGGKEKNHPGQAVDQELLPDYPERCDGSFPWIAAVLLGL